MSQRQDQRPGILRPPLPIGTARFDGPNEKGVALWRLTVHGAELPGLWVVIDREFRAEG